VIIQCTSAAWNSATGTEQQSRIVNGKNELDEVTFGPMQLLVIVFDNPNFHGQIRRELESVTNKE